MVESMMTRSEFLRAAGAGALGMAAGRAFATPAAEAQSASRSPINVLMIMTDQHHWQALGAAGNPLIRSPNLDRLAREGARFELATCPTPFCSPTRASIVTGLYPHTHGFVANVKGGMPGLKKGMFPTTENILADHGWATHHRGKWHLGKTGELGCYETLSYSGSVDFNARLKTELPASLFSDDEGDARLWGRPVYMTPAVAAGHRAYNADTGNKPQQDVSIIGRTAVPFELLPEAGIASDAEALVRENAGRPWMITASFSPPHACWVAPELYYSLVDRSQIRVPDNDSLPEWMRTSVSKRLGEYMGAGRHSRVSGGLCRPGGGHGHLHWAHSRRPRRHESSRAHACRFCL